MPLLNFRISRLFAAILALALAEAPAPRPAFALAPPAPRPYDGFGEFASTKVIVRLKSDAFRRSSIARADKGGDANVLPLLSGRFRATANAWGAKGMRRAFSPAFAHPALAEKHGLDRTFTIDVPAGTDTEALAAAIAAITGEVESASPDTIGGVAGEPVVPNDTEFSKQWGMNNFGQVIQQVAGFADADIDAPEAWGIHTGDIGTVTVAVLDSGVSSHQEFGNNAPPYPNGRIVQGYNTFLESSDPLNLQDGCPHGTHVAGIIAAGGNNGTGVAGVTWGAYIMPVRVLQTPPNGCSGLSVDLSEGIVWAADHGADIINMSLQYPGITPTGIAQLQGAINYAHDLGILLVGAAGNNNSCGYGIVCYPAKAANTLGISATDNRDQFPYFSNFGPEIDVAAPGHNIWSTWTNGTYNYQLGTSMATPHVVGLAALIKSFVPDLIHDEIAEIIMATAEDKGDPGWDNRFGWGRINAYYALKAAEVWPGITASEPSDGAIDARAPVDRTGTAAQGWSEVVMTFARESAGVAMADFAVESSTASAAPAITAVEHVDANRVRVVLDRPIDPLAWTTIRHLYTGTRVRLGFLPGDINGDGRSAPVDILALIDALNGVGPALAIWQTDIDHSGLAVPADILEVIDLLNGAGPFDPYNGATLPPLP